MDIRVQSDGVVGSLPFEKTVGNGTHGCFCFTLEKPIRGAWKLRCCLTFLLAASGVITAKSFQLDYKLDEVTESLDLYTYPLSKKSGEYSLMWSNLLTCKSPLWECSCWDRCVHQSHRPGRGPNCICCRSKIPANGYTFCRPPSPLLLKNTISFY
jgi:hypothetical protein